MADKLDQILALLSKMDAKLDQLSGSMSAQQVTSKALETMVGELHTSTKSGAVVGASSTSATGKPKVIQYKTIVRNYIYDADKYFPNEAQNLIDKMIETLRAECGSSAEGHVAAFKSSLERYRADNVGVEPRVDAQLTAFYQSREAVRMSAIKKFCENISAFVEKNPVSKKGAVGSTSSSAPKTHSAIDSATISNLKSNTDSANAVTIAGAGQAPAFDW